MNPIETRHSGSIPAPGKDRRTRILLTMVLALLLGVVAVLVALFRDPGPPPIPYLNIPPVGQVREPMPYRIVSFHRGRADKNLIRLAAQLGFNGVQFQIEGSNEEGIKEFAARDKKERLVEFCHSLGMKVTVWVHELSDLPEWYSPDYPGPVTVNNEKVWKIIDDRYEWILGEALPHIDGLVLTVVETQIRATDTPIMQKLVGLIDRQCRRHGKQLTVRTFVWHPDELEGVMGAVRQLPEDIEVMSKVVPQDWQMRGAHAAEIGAVGDRQQIVEFDIAGEYFLLNNVANCMVDRLKEQFDYALSKKVQGICVRVDRRDGSLPPEADNGNVLWQPNEVNLWALGMLSSGATADVEEVWTAWARYRYGEKAAPGVIRALQPTGRVVTEMLSVGPFTYGDTRGYDALGASRFLVPLPYEDVFSQNWQMWRWNPKLVHALAHAEEGRQEFIDGLRQEQSAALAAADECLAHLEKAKQDLSAKEYRILHTRLLSNKMQLQYRIHASLAALYLRQASRAPTQERMDRAIEQYMRNLAGVQALSATLRSGPKPRTLNYLGRKWQVDAPLALSPEQLDAWLELAGQASF